MEDRFWKDCGRRLSGAISGAVTGAACAGLGALGA